MGNLNIDKNGTVMAGLMQQNLVRQQLTNFSVPVSRIVNSKDHNSCKRVQNSEFCCSCFKNYELGSSQYLKGGYKKLQNIKSGLKSKY